jgi:hypothetical protein
LDSFLNSALNIEYVYMILTGLNAFIDNFEKRASEIENSNNRVSVLNMENTSDFAVLQFKNVKIKNQSKWHVGRAGSSSSNTSFMNLTNQLQSRDVSEIQLGMVIHSDETSVNSSSNKNSVSPNELDFINLNSDAPSTRKTSNGAPRHSL